MIKYAIIPKERDSDSKGLYNQLCVNCLVKASCLQLGKRRAKSLYPSIYSENACQKLIDQVYRLPKKVRKKFWVRYTTDNDEFISLELGSEKEIDV